jgi:hypothetical protein
MMPNIKNKLTGKVIAITSMKITGKGFCATKLQTIKRARKPLGHRLPDFFRLNNL